MNLLSHIYVITCIGSVDRQQHIRNHFGKLGLDWEFRTSINKDLLQDGSISGSEQSLLLAHRHCLMDAWINGFKNITICEDDVLFVDDLFEELQAFSHILPDDWNYLQLGNQTWAAHWLNRTKIKPNLYQFHWGTGSHCVTVNCNVFCETIKRFDSPMKSPTDFLYYSLYKEHKCYCPESFLADALSRNKHLDYNDTKHVFDSLVHHKQI